MTQPLKRSCTGCAKEEAPNELEEQLHWFHDHRGQWWHISCRHEWLHRQALLYRTPIKERHDGATTRSHRGSETSS